MILDISLSCILKTSVFFIDLLEKIRYRKKKVGLYVPAPLKQDVKRLLSNQKDVASLDIDDEVFSLVKDSERQKLIEDSALKKVVREKLIKLSFKEYATHFTKLIYISSDPELIRKNFRNKLFLIPNEVYTTTTNTEFNHDYMNLLLKEKDVKKNFKYFDSLATVLNTVHGQFC
jgi:hypothetical protein